jgi:hypothetical protein
MGRKTERFLLFFRWILGLSGLNWAIQSIEKRKVYRDGIFGGLGLHPLLTKILKNEKAKK